MAHPSMKQALERGDMVVAPGCWDAITARLFRYMGFKALYCPGSQTGMVLGSTEPLTTLTEMAMVGERVSEGVQDQLPVILDAGAGFGEPVHVIRTVEVLEDAGLTAIHIEDQGFPKRVSYHRGLEHVVPIDVYQQRIEYAVKARRDPNFLIIGRNDGVNAAPDPWLPNGGSKEESLKRAQAALEAGADIIMIMGMRDEDTFRWFRQRIKDVPMLAMGGFGPLGVNEYKSIGYQVVIYPQLSIQTSLRAVHDLWKSVKATGILPPPGDAWTLTGELLEMDKKYAIEAATTEAKSAVGATA